MSKKIKAPSSLEKNKRIIRAHLQKEILLMSLMGLTKNKEKLKNSLEKESEQPLKKFKTSPESLMTMAEQSMHSLVHCLELQQNPVSIEKSLTLEGSITRAQKQKLTFFIQQETIELIGNLPEKETTDRKPIFKFTKI